MPENAYVIEEDRAARRQFISQRDQQYSPAEMKSFDNSVGTGIVMGVAIAAAYLIADLFGVESRVLQAFGPLGTPIVAALPTYASARLLQR